MTPIDVMRAANSPTALCCDTVAAWIEACGHPVTFSRRQRMRMWEGGVMAGAVAAAQEIGLIRIPPIQRRDGDIVLFMQGGCQTLGVSYGGRSFMAAGGPDGIARNGSFIIPPLMAWRIPCRR